MLYMKARNVSILGHVVLCVGFLLTSIVPALGYAVFTFGVLVGVGANFIVHATTVVILEWFHGNNFGRANAIAVMGSSIGNLFCFQNVVG